ncbi:MAG: NADH-quinone oxidoreductase subunit L [Chitinophagaceae bacterium]
MINYIWLVPLFPLIGFLVTGLLRNSLSRSMTGIIGSGVILASFIMSILVFMEVRHEGFTPQVISLFDFISIGDLHIPFAFQVDQLSTLFLLIITGVGFLIHVYSTSYMHGEPAKHFARYFSFLNLFVFSMLLLVLGSNYVIMFIGWEGVGLCSYLLIGFWFKNQDYNNAAKKAFIMNRIGDLGFLLAVFWMIDAFGTVNFLDLFNGNNGKVASISAINSPVIVGITLLLFVGATGKSAQIPLYTWLPDAMAGPTPVSALIHAATMVTAGIYMIARSNLMYSLAPTTMTVVAIVGLATVILAASIALKQNDIKKVLAYSTVSQLGYMFLGLGVGAYTGAVFHVMTHAFFKALLFLGAGSVIHAMSGEQDIRRMGGLKKQMPITYITFLVGCIAIAGIPPFSGFFSKDEILMSAFAKNPVLYFIGATGTLMTAWYMFRLLSMTFAGKFRGTEEQAHHLHESPRAITIPLVILAVLSIIAGFVGIPELFMNGGHRLDKFLSPVFAQSNAILGKHEIPHYTEYILMGTTVALVLIASIVAWRDYTKFKGGPRERRGLGKILEDKWYVDELYDAIFVKPLKSLSVFFNKVIERSFIDGLVNGIGRGINYSSRQVRLLQNGQVGSYILMMVVGIIVLFLIQMFVK